MKYIHALDGVRCCAVFLVALFHFYLFAAGWIGVQVFFVLSGYLITQLLLESKVKYRGVYFRRFYWRRTLRICPLYFAYIAVVAILFLTYAIPHELTELWLYLLTYTSNFSRMGINDRGGEFFVHLWSLAVEGQFYLVWPVIVLLLSERTFRHLVGILLLTVPVARFAIGIWMQNAGLESDQVARILETLTLTQLDSFATGAALTVFGASEWRRSGRTAVMAIGVWLIAGAAMLISLPEGAQGWRQGWSLDTLGHRRTMINYYHVWGPTLTNLTSAAVILAAMNGAGRFLFQNPIARNVGRVSYGVYIFHLPILHLLNRLVTYDHASWSGIGVFCLYFAAVVGLANFSYWGFESRFLRLKNIID